MMRLRRRRIDRYGRDTALPGSTTLTREVIIAVVGAAIGVVVTRIFRRRSARPLRATASGGSLSPRKVVDAGSHGRGW